MTTTSIYLQHLISFIPALNVFFGSKAGVEPLGHYMPPMGEELTDKLVTRPKPLSSNQSKRHMAIRLLLNQ